MHSCTLYTTLQQWYTKIHMLVATHVQGVGLGDGIAGGGEVREAHACHAQALLHAGQEPAGQLALGLQCVVCAVCHGHGS